MKLRNKKTGERGIINYFDNQSIVIYPIDENWNAKGDKKYIFHSLAELNEEWEDYEEPKEYWYMDYAGFIRSAARTGNSWEVQKKIGNCFETKEEAEKAVEKLKAWKRLKDKGFRFEGIKQDYTRFFSQQKPIRIGRKYLQFNKAEDEEWLKENCEDLDLLFGDSE